MTSGGWAPPGGPEINTAIKAAQAGVGKVLADLKEADKVLTSIASKSRAVAGAWGGKPAGGVGATALNIDGLHHSPEMFGASHTSALSMSGGGAGGGGPSLFGYAMPKPPTPLNPSQFFGGYAGSGFNPPPSGGGGGYGSRFGSAAALSGIGMALSGQSSANDRARANDILYNRMLVGAGTSWSPGMQNGMGARVTSELKGGFVSPSDRSAMAQTLAAYSPGTSWLGGYGRSVANFAAMTGMSGGDAAGVAANLNNGRNFRTLRMYGIQTRDPVTGAPVSPGKVADQMYNVTYAGRKNARENVMAGLQQGGSIQSTLSDMGYNPEQVQQMGQVFLNRTGMNKGTGNTIRVNDARLASASATGEDISQGGRLDYMKAQADLTAEIKKLTNAINRASGGAGGFMGGALGGPLGGLANTAANDALLYGLLKGGGAATAGRGLLARGGSLLGKIPKAAGVAGLAGVGLNLGGQALKGSGHSTAGGLMSVAGDAATGAALGSFIGPEGTIAGGVLGAGYGVLSNFFADGGVIPGNHTRDDVPIYATPGEVVVPRHVVAMHGGAKSLMRGLGFQGKSGVGHFARGGVVEGAISVAESFVGRPYKWGGNNPSTSFDCSGLLQWAYGQQGVHLPRVSQDQQNAGSPVDLGHLQRGDALFYGNPAEHEAMYLGNGMMIEAPHTGAFIRNVPYRPATSARRFAGGSGGSSGGDSGGGGVSGAAAAGGAAAGGGGGGSPWLRRFNTGWFKGGRGSSSGGGGSSAGVSSAPSNPSGNAALGKRMAAKYGWGSGSEWDSLYALWMKESSWRSDAQNPTSTAYGIAQFLDTTWSGYGATKTSDPGGQISAGLKYIKGRYGDPNAAMKHESANNWYAKGAWRTKNEEANLHEGEMVLPSAIATQVRSMMAGGHQVGGMTPGSHGGSRGGSHGACHVTIKIENATPAEAMKFAQTVKGHLEHDRAMSKALVG